MFSLGLLTLWKLATQSWWYESSPMEGGKWWGTQVSCQQPALTCQLSAPAALEVNLPAPVKPSEDSNRGQHLNWKLPRDSEAEPLNQVAPEFLNLKNIMK